MNLTACGNYNYLRNWYTQRFTTLILSLIIFHAAHAQGLTPKYISTSIDSKAYYEYVPEEYSKSNESYPLIISMHGTGGFGNGSPSELKKVSKNGVPGEIKKGKFPKSFTVNGQRFKFIVIAPQFIDWPTPENIEAIIDYAIAHYRVNKNRIYLTGYSMGGGSTWNYIGNKDAYANRIAAVVPVCGANYPDMTRSRIIAKANVAVWATHNDGDPQVPVFYTNDYVANINLAPPPNPLAKKTIFHQKKHDAWTKTYDPDFRENGLNIYEWMLKYQRGNSNPQPTVNKAPKVNAGTNQTIQLPRNSVTLSGNGTDEDGTIKSYLWTKTSGPKQGNITKPKEAKTTVTGLVKGTYIFQLKATDNKGAAASDAVEIIVNAASANKNPVVNAGNDKTITLPDNSVTLTGSATDADGSIKSYLWTKISGPDKGSISSAAAARTAIVGLVQGTYQFQLKATDNRGGAGKDVVKVTVNAAHNIAPKVNAGGDQFITLPVNSVMLKGSATDADGSIRSYKWSQVSGPSNANIADPYNAATTARGLIKGTYLFQLKATDNKGDAATDVIKITVSTAMSSGTITKFVKVNIFGGENAYNNKEWNNWNVGTAERSNISAGNLRYSDGTSSTIHALLSHSQAVGDNRSNYHGGMAPAEVLRYTSYSARKRTLTLSGLSTNKKYNIELYASRYSIGNATIFTINNTSETVNVYDNYNHKAMFTNIAPNAQGQIVVELKMRTNYTHLNGFIVTEQGTNYKNNTASTVATQSIDEEASSPGVTDEEAAVNDKASFGVYPNPVHDQLVLQLNNKFTGTMKVQLVDMNGRVRKEFTFVKDQPVFTNTLPVSELSAGSYIINIRAEGYHYTKQVIIPF